MKTAIANRLATYRQWAAESKNTNDWRKFTWVTNRSRTGYRKTERSFTYGENGRIYADEKETMGEYMGDWQSFASYRDMRDTSGFYADNFCCETIRGGVLRIRSAKGTYYAPLTYCTGWDGVIIYMNDAELVPKGATESEHEKAQKEAANSAFYRAEKEADKARDDDAKCQAESRIDDLRYELRDILADTRQTVKAIREQQQAGEIVPKICQLLRENLKENRKNLRDRIRFINELKENYWLAVPQ